ncbi:MAG: T9SS type A sorting domain-containing protein [Chitinophagaceae bacterium]
MKKKFLPLALLAVVAANAQQSDKAYALTDARKGGYNWNQIQQVDLRTGEIKALTYDGRNVQNAPDAKLAAAYPQGYAYNNGAAALAFDKKNNRLYFAPMFVAGTIRYIDLGDKTMTPHQITFDQKLNEADMEATNFTRMVIGADGNGYAITNDANTFIRFGTGKNSTVENLGGLIDDVSNGGISVHNRCSSWGGDMIADAYGSMYMITMRQNVFKVNPTSRVATYLGHIDGLPADFTCNGAAVNADGKVVVSGAAYTKGYFEVDLKSLKAAQLGDNTDVFNASDLATSNLYGQSEVDNSLNKMVTIEQPEVGNDKIRLYPNPVTDGRIMVSFDAMGAGNYTIELADQAAKAISRKVVSISGKGQTTLLNADSKLAKGMYFVRVIDANKKLVLASRIVVQ